LAAIAAEKDRPNILWITCEDMSPHLGCYGDRYAHTPNLDRLAAEGVRYTRAFATASVCTPARSCLITGVFASSLGTQHLRGPQPLAPTVCCFTQYLRESGYYCSNRVKEDYNFRTPPAAWDESSKKAHWRGRKPGQPFFSVFNFMGTHQGQVRYGEEEFRKVNATLKPEERHDPATVPLPPYYPDTPIVRRIQAQMHTQMTLVDKEAGELLAQLDADGLADDTIVFFYSDHGTGLPRHKRWLFDSGIRVPLVIRFPKKYERLAPGKPGAAIDRLVSFVDFAPTVLSLAGVAIPDYMQGVAFLGPRAGKPRQYVFAIRDRVDEVYECSRTVRDERYQYIRNYFPHRPRMQFSTFSEITPIRQEIRRLAAEGKLEGDAAWLMSPTTPPEELYDTQTDPHEMRNLVGSPAHREVLDRLRAVLHDWMIDTRDTGLLAEVEMCRRAKGRSPYDMARGQGEYEIERILDAAEQVGKGPESCPSLVRLLADKDAGVRYWAATGLTALGPDAKPAEAALETALADESPNVRLAAAEALCRIGGEKRGLPVLVEALEDPDERLRLQAAITLAALGENARGAKEALRKAHADAKGGGDYPMFIRWGLEQALRNVGE
jgi:uncharacterized sulfatase